MGVNWFCNPEAVRKWREIKLDYNRSDMGDDILNKTHCFSEISNP